MSRNSMLEINMRDITKNGNIYIQIHLYIIVTSVYLYKRKHPYFICFYALGERDNKDKTCVFLNDYCMSAQSEGEKNDA